MTKRGDLAVLGALACAAAAGAVIGLAAGGTRARRAPTPQPQPHPLAPVPRFALPPPRAEHRASAFALAAPEQRPARRTTYETVRADPARIRRIAVVVAGGVAMLMGALAIVIASIVPEVTALAAPSVVYPGTNAVVAYAAAGLGTFSYGFDAPSGRRSGVLSGRQGALEIPVTRRDANGDIVVVVRAAGLFGSDVRVARIRVLARPRAALVRIRWNGVRIDALGLSAATVASGGEIAVRYRSNATSGSVTLRDVRGGTWQSKPLSTTGLTLLRAPVSDRDAPFTVVLQARRNGAAIENGVALIVTGTARPVASLAASPPPSPATRDIPAVARSGSDLITSAGAGRRATVIELTGTGGVALQRATPRADGTTQLRMPVVTAPRSYLISVSYQSGAGRESSFHWIRVLPAKR